MQGLVAINYSPVHNSSFSDRSLHLRKETNLTSLILPVRMARHSVKETKVTIMETDKSKSKSMQCDPTCQPIGNKSG